MLQLRIARGGVGKVPLSRLQDASRSACTSLSQTGAGGTYHTAHLSHIIYVLLIPLEFPTLLAMREIIANAYILPIMSFKYPHKAETNDKIIKNICFSH